MSPRHFPLACAVLAASLTSSNLHSAWADDPPVPPPAPLAPVTEVQPAPENQPAPPPLNATEDGPRRRGEGEGRGEGGPRGEGRGRGEGGRRGEGGPRGGGPGGPDMNLSPEERRQRALAPYEEMVPDLTEPQKTHIMAIIEAANAESRAVRENTTLSEERQRTVGRAIRLDIPNRVRAALTETQLVGYDAKLAEQAEVQAEMAKVGSVRPTETAEEMRARILTGYEPVMEELSVKQKTSLISILEDAAEQTDAINADTVRTPEQKKAALLQVHTATNAKVLPLLDADQRKTWEKAHTAKRP